MQPAFVAAWMLTLPPPLLRLCDFAGYLSCTRRGRLSPLISASPQWVGPMMTPSPQTSCRLGHSSPATQICTTRPSPQASPPPPPCWRAIFCLLGTLCVSHLDHCPVHSPHTPCPVLSPHPPCPVYSPHPCPLASPMSCHSPHPPCPVTHLIPHVLSIVVLVNVARAAVIPSRTQVPSAAV